MMHGSRRIGLAVIGASICSMLGVWAPRAEAAPVTVRVAGDNRYGTAAALSQRSFPDGARIVFIASGLDFADALTAAPAAAAAAGPLLLVSDRIPIETEEELFRLQPERVVVVGGTSVVGDDIESELLRVTAMSGAPAEEIERVAGPDRYATAALVSAAFFEPNVATAYVATGVDFPDSLTGGAAAAAAGGPVLLSGSDVVPAVVTQELARLTPGVIVVLGGEPVLSAAVEQQLQTFTAGSVSRVSGEDRFGTSVSVSSASYPAGATAVFLANGFGFADALSGAVVAGGERAPLLLVTADCIPAAVGAELARLAPDEVVILGGPVAISPAVEALTPCAELPPPAIDFLDGTYIVGTEVPAGTFRTLAAEGLCYWERLAGFSGGLDDIIANGLADGAPEIVTIASTDAGFSSSGCGSWSNVLAPLKTPDAPFGDGTFQVGEEIAPGTWRSSEEAPDSCYWERLSGFSGELADIDANDISEAAAIVTIGASDVGFHSSGCGTWSRIG